MKVSVYYEEVSNYVEKHYLVRPSIKQVDDKTVSRCLNTSIEKKHFSLAT